MAHGTGLTAVREFWGERKERKQRKTRTRERVDTRVENGRSHAKRDARAFAGPYYYIILLSSSGSSRKKSRVAILITLDHSAQSSL